MGVLQQGGYTNEPPYCAELYNARSLPYGFRSFNLVNLFGDGFPVWFDINLSQEDATRFFEYVQQGLYYDSNTRWAWLLESADRALQGFVAAGATAQPCRQGRSVSAVGEPMSCSDCPSAAAGHMPLLPTTCAAGSCASSIRCSPEEVVEFAYCSTWLVGHRRQPSSATQEALAVLHQEQCTNPAGPLVAAKQAQEDVWP